MKSVLRSIVTVVFALAMALVAGGGIDADDQCGDVNLDGSGPNIGDVCYLIGYMFQNTPPAPYYRPAELDGRWHVDINDLIALIEVLFRGGPMPPCAASGLIDDGAGCLADSIAPRETGFSMATSSGCTQQTAEERMWAEMHGNELHVYHYDVEYNCCIIYDVTYSIEGSAITVYEYDRQTDPCLCLCYFNLESVYSGLPAGGHDDFVVTLIGVYGDTIGVDTIPVAPDNGTLQLEVVGNDLHVRHLNAIANCCPAFFFDSYVEPGMITVIEWDSLFLCDCICRFDLESVVSGLDPGQYTVTVLGVCNYPYGAECDTVGVGSVVVSPARQP